MVVSSRPRQVGAAVIEFALVLPLLLAIVVGIIYYGYAFVLKTAVEHAAKNGAQAAVAVDPLIQDYKAVFKEAAEDAALDSMSWLPDSVITRLKQDGNIKAFEGAPCAGAYGVTVKLPLSGDDPVLPQFSLGGFRIPPLGSGEDGVGPEISSTACVTL